MFCAGFTKEMAKDINIELGLEEDSDSDNEKGDEPKDDNEEEPNHGNEKEQTSIEQQNQLNLQDFQEKLEATETFLSKLTCAGKYSVENESDGSSEIGSADFETGSVRSTATTIHPDEIKRRVKKQYQLKEKKEYRKKCIAKGEANAVTRIRRQNADTIKHSGGIWGWE